METIWVAGGESAALGAGKGLKLGRLMNDEETKTKGKTLSQPRPPCQKKLESKKTVLGMMACAAAGAAVISKSAGAMFSNESVPADEGLLLKNKGSAATGRAVERVDVSSSKATTTTSTPSPPSDA